MDLKEKQKLLKKIKNINIMDFTQVNNPNLKVACILDRFSFDCFKYECKLKYLPYDSWADVIDDFCPDFLLVESAWEGIDKSWRGQIANIKNKETCEIRKVIDYCHQKHIPTVFWNKEDPPNYSNFIEIAKLFDFVFTTDQNSIPRYYCDLNHKNVYVLPFAAQPAIHNPVNSGLTEKENVAFAGSWYTKKYIKRQIELRILLQPSLAYNLHIFDRNFQKDDDFYEFPEEYREHIVGGLDYEDMVKAYKLYKVFLNVNSVRESPTMFSRRVFEMLASGANVISTYSEGIRRYFSKIVPTVFSEEETNRILSVLLSNKEVSERISLLGIREVNAKHTYQHRLNTILDKIGQAEKIGQEKGVSIIAYTDDEFGLKNILECYRKQRLINKELIIITDNSLSFPQFAEENVSIVQDGKGDDWQETMLKRCKYPYIAVFHDRDYYAPYYLTDLLHAFNYTDADIVGKASYYEYNSESKLLSLYNRGNENLYTKRVHKYALLIKKERIGEVKSIFDIFHNKEEESLFENAKIYSADRFSYVSLKSNKSFDSLGAEIVCCTQDFETHVNVEENIYINFEEDNDVIKEKTKAFNQRVVREAFSPGYPGIEKLLLEKIKNHSVIIYGAGEHTERLLSKIHSQQLNIIGLVDRDKNKQGKSLWNLKVFSPEEIEILKPDYIIISSLAYEEEIYKELTNKYNDIIVYPVYGANEQFRNDIFKELYICKFPLDEEYVASHDF